MTHPAPGIHQSSPPLIGVRDSGVGGLTVAKRVREACANSPLLYFADTAHVPYGERSPQEVRHYALSISEFLIERGAGIVVFACNTTSAYALDAARERFSVPIIGVIEPGARLAIQAARGGTIGVLATHATVQSGVYSRVLRALSPHARVVEIACPQFVPLVESEQTRSVAAHRAAEEYLRPLLDAGARTIILGCTHYPLLLPVLREVAPGARFVDPAVAVAQEVAREVMWLATPATPPGKSPGVAACDACFISGERASVQHWAAQLMPDWKPRFERGPVFDLPSEEIAEF